MDRRKVKELIENAIYQLDPFTMDGDNYDNLCKNATNILEQALKELSESDWISVEDALPPYEEVVDIRMESKHDTCYCTSKRVKGMEQSKNLDYDKNDFVVLGYIYHVTHWKPLEKLEE